MASKHIPEIRFKGFEDEWEEDTINNIADFFDEKRIPIESDKRKVGKYPYYGATGIIDFVEDFIFDGNYVLLAEDGANLIARTNPISYYVTGKFWVNNHSHVMKIKKGSNYFFSVLLEKQNYTIYNTGTAQPKLNGEILKKICVVVPNEIEQKKIGTFFKQLDDSIDCRQQELDHLKQTKQAFLQKMFPKEGQTVPEVRFKGFDGAWEEKKLGDFSERISRKNNNLDSSLPLTISAQYGLIDQTTFFNKIVASKDLRGYYLVKKGEFAYNKSYSKDYPWGAVKRLDLYEQGVLSTLYIVFKPVDIYSDFLVSYYDSTYWYKEISNRASEGARNHGLLNIYPSDFFESKIKIPSIEEQQKIGTFFKQLDDKIQLHERELEGLKQTKQAFLQKMFV